MANEALWALSGAFVGAALYDRLWRKPPPTEFVGDPAVLDEVYTPSVQQTALPMIAPLGTEWPQGIDNYESFLDYQDGGAAYGADAERDCGCGGGVVGSVQPAATYGGVDCGEGRYNIGTDAAPDCVAYSDSSGWNTGDSSTRPDSSVPSGAAGGLIAPGTANRLTADAGPSIAFARSLRRKILRQEPQVTLRPRNRRGRNRR